MSELPEKPRGSRPYLPPPPDGSPESVEVPRMEPPPPSLEAMVRTPSGSPLFTERRSTWGWIALIVIVVGAIAYYLEIYRPS